MRNTLRYIGLIFAKSEEEFFDLYDESDISLKFNVADHVEQKVGTNQDGLKYAASFLDLGYAFSHFISAVNAHVR